MTEIEDGPLPSSGEWTHDVGWSARVAELDHPEEAGSFLSALREVFPPKRARTMKWPSHYFSPPSHHPSASRLERHHPLLSDYITVRGRHRLLELGAALAKLPIRLKSTRDRLHSSDHFLTTYSELRVGLLLRDMGLVVTHEPLGTGGPDWLATTRRGSQVAVEVKCLHESSAARGRMGVVIDVDVAIRRKLESRASTRSASAWCEVTLAEELIEAVRSSTGRREMVDLIATSFARALDGYDWSCDVETFPVADLGFVSVRRPVPEGPKFVVTNAGFLTRTEHGMRRIRDALLDASRQLAKIADAPGIVVLDSVLDVPMFCYHQDIEDLLHSTEEWTQRIAAVVILGPDLLAERDRFRLAIAQGPNSRDGVLRFCGADDADEAASTCEPE